MNHSRSISPDAGAPEFFSPHVASARRFYLDLNPARRQHLVVVCGGLEQCTEDYAINRVSFPFYSLEYVARGSGTVKFKRHSHELRPGCFFSYGPSIPHQITGTAGDPLTKYFVDFTGLDAAELLRTCKLTAGSVAQVFPPDAMANLFEELIESGQRGGPGDAALCVKLLEGLALKLNVVRTSLIGTETIAFTTYQDCRRHIEENFLRLRTLKQIAAECHANVAYLCRLFRRYNQQSPYQYLLRLKMGHATERLQQPGAMVKQVAEEVGFADPFHFSRVFKSVLGLSPVGFKKLR